MRSFLGCILLGLIVTIPSLADTKAKITDRALKPIPGKGTHPALKKQLDKEKAAESVAIKKEQNPLSKEGLARAKKIIQHAEALRSVNKSKSTAQVKTIVGKQKTQYQMNVLQAPGRKAYLEFTAPDEEVGRRMLAIKTRYWGKFPDSRRVVSISRREAIGNSAFAIADVFQMDVEEDYNARILGEEKLGATDSIKLQLDAKHSKAPYHQIIYYVRKSDYYPMMSKFYGVSKKHLKTMTVEKSYKLAGKKRPGVLKMVDNVTKGRISWWKTKTLKKMAVSDQVFTKAYLKGR